MATGAAIGYLFGHAALHSGHRFGSMRFAENAEAGVSLAAVFLAYGLAGLIGGYGFLSVFAAVLT